MGPLFVVLSHLLRTYLAHLLPRLEYVGIKHLVTEGLIEPFHNGILIRLARLNIPWRDPSVRTPPRKSIGEAFGTMVEQDGLRLTPRRRSPRLRAPLRPGG